MAQPLVFYRHNWDFRWLSRAAVVARLAGERATTNANNPASHSDDEPLEVEQCLEALRQDLDSPEGPGADSLAANSEQLAQAIQASAGRHGGLGAKRDVIVVPGGWHRSDSELALRCAVSTGAAIVLPPEEGAFAWTTVWARPTIVVAAQDQLAALDQELGTTRRRKARRSMARLRSVLQLCELDQIDTGTAVYASLVQAAPEACQMLSLQPYHVVTT